MNFSYTEDQFRLFGHGDIIYIGHRQNMLARWAKTIKLLFF